MKRYIDILLALLLCVLLFQSCADEEIIASGEKEGNASVTFTLKFSDLDIISPFSRSAGDAIEKMSDVCILFYDAATGNLINDYTIYQSLSEPKDRETFTRKIKSGSYKIYAVANMGNLVGNEDVQTIDGLKSITLQWNMEDSSRNNQMFGFFEESQGDNVIDEAVGNLGLRQVTPTAYDAKSITVEGAKTVYAKLYRAASKITIAYDGKDLNDNIFITIKSVSLKRIPVSCGLWTNNKPSSEEVIETGETLSYGGEGLEVKNDGTIKGGHNGEALYMFENRQGVNKTVTSQKQKDPGVVDNITKAGTYIEVQAHYANQNNAPGVATQFDIVYRYMLGEDDFDKNIFNNFNVTRNRHYKVTMIFSGSGKEKPVWRVDYTEEEKPEISVPDEIYISYLPGEQLTIPVAFPKATGGVTCTVSIKENPWYYVGHNYARYAKDNRNGFLNIGDSWTGPASVRCSNVNGIMTGNIEFKTAPMSFRGTGNGDNSFTGYNPFFAHQRIATVNIVYDYYVGNQRVRGIKSVTIKQTERIVNPMGIFRKADSNSSFDVTIMKQEAEDGDTFNFEPLDSYGPWTVSVDKVYSEGNGDWIKLTDSEGIEKTEITGKSGKIHFTYQPKGTISENEVRCGRIKVTYHNNYCTHYIYVRQGYAPVALSRGDKWTSYNLVGKSKYNGSMQTTDSPIAEGSFLKVNSALGIVYQNNDKYGFEGRGGNSDASYLASDGKYYTWGEYKMNNRYATSYTSATTTGRYPNNDEYAYIEDDNRTFKAFGVVYDDSSIKTAESSNQAFGYTVESRSGKGMRGMLVQDKDGAHNVLFFPIGTKGYGRRRDTCPVEGYAYGALHYTYAGKDGYDETNYESRPLLADLYKHHGAIYWTASKSNTLGLSFNYNVCNVERGIYDGSSGLRIKDDACYTRLIVK